MAPQDLDAHRNPAALVEPGSLGVVRANAAFTKHFGDQPSALGGIVEGEAAILRSMLSMGGRRRAQLDVNFADGTSYIVSASRADGDECALIVFQRHFGTDVNQRSS